LRLPTNLFVWASVNVLAGVKYGGVSHGMSFLEEDAFGMPLEMTGVTTHARAPHVGEVENLPNTPFRLCQHIGDTDLLLQGRASFRRLAHVDHRMRPGKSVHDEQCRSIGAEHELPRSRVQLHARAP
jgi:hypothetical protein